MSSKLVTGLYGVHNFQDDLESTIYVLLWMVLMYSETSDGDRVPTFLSGVLDPEPHMNNAGFGKADFLKARTFLQVVTFPQRPALHRLINQLAILFAVQYEHKPSDAEEKTADVLKKSNDAAVAEAYMTTVSYSYWTRIEQLKDHQHTIKLFDDALRDHTLWPANDNAVKQVFRKDSEPSHHRLVTKTGWDTSFFVHGISNEADCVADMEIDEASYSDTSGSEWSDQMNTEWSDQMNTSGSESDQTTVADDSEIGNSSLLREMYDSNFYILYSGG